MKGRTVLKGYLRSRLPVLLLVALFEGLTAIVYGLYGLPWGPLVYTLLLLTVVTVGLLLLGLRQYAKRLRALDRLAKQAADQLPALPASTDAMEQCWLRALAAVEAGRRTEQAAATEAETLADRYYTLWSHQIKTPLAAMRLLLQEEPADREALSQELLRTEQYVEMALGYQRLRHGQGDLVLTHCSLDVLVRQAVKRVSPLFIHKKLSLELCHTGRQVLTDEKWLCFVLEQLLTNAIKYTQSGGVTIKLLPESVCTLVIADTGIGILPEDLPRVFEWGYTGCNGRLDKRSTGIGLYLCRQTMQLLHHGISIRSQPGQGTQVLLELDRAALDVE